MPVTADTVLEVLRERGMRSTPQRRAIVAEILRTKGHINATEIARRVSLRVPGVNASTVYRTLDLLEQLDVVSHMHLEGGSGYHRTEEGNHVHLICSRCGADESLEEKEANKLEAMIGKHSGFSPDLTHFAIAGLCAKCQRKHSRR
ncbi:MAG: Fur family transcriptional regulator [Actinomycetota bacterium]